MKDEDKKQLELEIKHILESGPNEVRFQEMFERFYDKRVDPLLNRVEILQKLVDIYRPKNVCPTCFIKNPKKQNKNEK